MVNIIRNGEDEASPCFRVRPALRAVPLLHLCELTLRSWAIITIIISDE